MAQHQFSPSYWNGAVCGLCYEGTSAHVPVPEGSEPRGTCANCDTPIYHTGGKWYHSFNASTVCPKHVLPRAIPAASQPSSSAREPELHSNPRVNDLLVSLRRIRDKASTLDKAKEIAFLAIQNFIEAARSDK